MGAVQVSRKLCVPLATAPGFALRADAAAAWDRAVAKLAKRVLLTGAWRSYATQERLFRERYVRGNLAGSPGFTSDVRFWQGGPWTRRRGTAAAAVPGTSNHGGGLAVDVKTRRAGGDPGRETSVIFTGWKDPDRVRFLRLAAEHGWDDDEGRSVDEVWHLTYYAARDQHHRGLLVSNPLAAASTVTIPALPKAPTPITPEDDMAGYRFTFRSAIFYANPATGAFYRLPNTEAVRVLESKFEPTDLGEVNERERDVIADLCRRAANSIKGA